MWALTRICVLSFMWILLRYIVVIFYGPLQIAGSIYVMKLTTKLIFYVQNTYQQPTFLQYCVASLSKLHLPTRHSRLSENLKSRNQLNKKHKQAVPWAVIITGGPEYPCCKTQSSILFHSNPSRGPTLYEFNPVHVCTTCFSALHTRHSLLSIPSAVTGKTYGTHWYICCRLLPIQSSVLKNLSKSNESGAFRLPTTPLSHLTDWIKIRGWYKNIFFTFLCNFVHSCGKNKCWENHRLCMFLQ